MPQQPGDHTKLRDATPAEIDAAIALARRPEGFVTVVAKYLKVDRKTLEDWLARGDAGVAPYADFAARYRQAEAELEGELVAQVLGGEKGKWSSAAWTLERRFPTRWGKREHHTLSGPKGGAIQTETLARVVLLPPLDDEPGGDRSAVAPEPGPAGTVPGVPRQ